MEGIYELYLEERFVPNGVPFYTNKKLAIKLYTI